jgi:hypothetical protein
MFESTVNSTTALIKGFENSNFLIQLIAITLITTAAIVGIACAIIWELTVAIFGGIVYSLLKG